MPCENLHVRTNSSKSRSSRECISIILRNGAEGEVSARLSIRCEIGIGNKKSSIIVSNVTRFFMDNLSTTPRAANFCSCCRKICWVFLTGDSYKLAALNSL